MNDLDTAEDAGKQHNLPSHRYLQPIPKRPSGVTAGIYVSGLSVMCPSAKKDAWEIAFVEANHQPVKVRVMDWHCKKVEWQFEAQPGEKVLIDVRKTGTSGANPGRKYQPQLGTGGTPPDAFDWMPDLTATYWHNREDIRLRPDAINHLSAKLALSDACFYTHRLGVGKAIQQVLRDGQGRYR